MTEFHMATALFERIGKYGDRTAIRYRQNDVWREISWNSLGEQVRAAAKGLLAMGVERRRKGRHLFPEPPGVDHRRLCDPLPPGRFRPDLCHQHAEAGRIRRG